MLPCCIWYSFLKLSACIFTKEEKNSVCVCTYITCMHTYINHSRMRVETHFTTQKSYFNPKALKELSYANRDLQLAGDKKGG